MSFLRHKQIYRPMDPNQVKPERRTAAPASSSR